jgi:hypothetical protein
MEDKTLFTKKIISIVFLLSITGIVPSFADQEKNNVSPSVASALNHERLSKMEKWRSEMEDREFKIYTETVQILLNLKLELRKLPYSTTDEVIRQKVKGSLELAKKIVALDGEMLTNRIDFVLRAKNFLAEEQFKELVGSLDFELGVLDDYLYIVDTTFSADELDLSSEQAKKHLRNRYEMMSKELELEYKIDDKIVDLQQHLFADKIDTAAIESIVSEITALGNEMMDNRWNTRLEAWNILTTEQKSEMLNWIMLIAKP